MHLPARRNKLLLTTRAAYTRLAHKLLLGIFMKRLLFLAILTVPALALAAKAPRSAPQILAKAKAASGGAAWNRIHSLRSKGTIKAGGLTGTYTSLEDLSTGRSVIHFKLGPIAGAQGFDGKRGWTKQPGGEVAPDDSPKARKADATGAYRTAHGYWRPQRWPAKIASLGKRTSDGKTFQVLRITPRGGNPFELWINAKTHLIARTVDRSSVPPETTYFSDFRTVHGVKMPFHRRISNGKKQYDRILQINKVAVNGPVSVADFAMPKQAFHDASIIGGGNRATIPFKLVNNHIYVFVTINGHAFRFILDTGARNVLLNQSAKRAGIKSKGALQAGGAGRKSVNAGFGKVKKLVIGGKIKLTNQDFAVLAMPGFRNVEGTQFDGLVGYELFKRFVTRIDYANQKLTFIKPGDFDPTDAGTAVPFTSAGGGIPFVKGSIDGIPSEFEVDTGSRAALSLFAPFAKAHNLYSRYEATNKATVGWGVGGSAKGRVARGGKLAIGKVSFKNPVVELSTSQKGALARKQIAGNIGDEILKRFTVTFDYAHRRMYLKPNENYGKPMNYDRSGMWINRQGTGFIVKSVMADGPADKADLKAGDVITQVNGKLSAKIGLPEFRKMLRNDPPGAHLRLTVETGKSEHKATLVLHRLIPKKGGLKNDE
jgi:hypothetical protein